MAKNNQQHGQTTRTRCLRNHRGLARANFDMADAGPRRKTHDSSTRRGARADDF